MQKTICSPPWKKPRGVYKRIALLSSPKRAAITPEEADQIRARHADCLDPNLRKPDGFTDGYPQYITLTNERFGPFRNEGYRNPMETMYA